jgi:redox-sensitive bicupin YhaK (pirin superfamily)
MFFIEAWLDAGAELAWPAEHTERGVHVIDGTVEWGGVVVPPGRVAVQAGEQAPPLRAAEASRVMLFGGAPLDGERHLWWNFVASSSARIEQAKTDWRDGRFEQVPGDEDEFIPLPTH